MGDTFFINGKQHLVLWNYKKEWVCISLLFYMLKKRPLATVSFQLSPGVINLRSVINFIQKNEATKNFKMADSVATNTTPLNYFDFFFKSHRLSNHDNIFQIKIRFMQNTITKRGHTVGIKGCKILIVFVFRLNNVVSVWKSILLH